MIRQMLNWKRNVVLAYNGRGLTRFLPHPQTSIPAQSSLGQKSCLSPCYLSGGIIKHKLAMKHGIFNTFFEGRVFNHLIIVNNFFKIMLDNTKLYRIFVV